MGERFDTVWIKRELSSLRYEIERHIDKIRVLEKVETIVVAGSSLLSHSIGQNMLAVKNRMHEPYFGSICLVLVVRVNKQRTITSTVLPFDQVADGAVHVPATTGDK